jgi:DNA topoisomerase-1
MEESSNKYLFIVENNQKKETYNAVLNNSDYVILSSAGRIKKKLNEQGEYVLEEHSKKFLLLLKKTANEYSKIFLSLDNDDDGEKIAWDIIEFLDKNNIKTNNIFRITPQSISKDEIVKSFNYARYIDKNKIDAQMTRRAVEKIINYDISKMLRWGMAKEDLLDDVDADDIKIGRVSAPALGLIVEAQEKIDTFIPGTYKRVAVDYFYDNVEFTVKNKLKFTDERKDELLAFLSMVNKEPHIVSTFEKGTKDKAPPPPLNSIDLQHSASYQLILSPLEIMKIAKELYEGIVIEGKKISLITYYKSKSRHFSDETIFQIINLAVELFGEEYSFKTRRIFNNNDEDKYYGQEAIRPTFLTKEFHPDEIKKYLNEDQFLLYEYIYTRTVATQMTSAIFNKGEIVVVIGGAKFFGEANDIIFDGWLKVGSKWQEQNSQNKNNDVTFLPERIALSQELQPLDVSDYKVPERTPWRYGEGRFVKTLEKQGIANASFVANISEFLKQQNYIKAEQSMLYPTLLGKRLYFYMKEHVPWLLDLEYVVKLEKDIYLISEGKKSRKEIVDEYEKLKNEASLKLEYDEDELPEEWLIAKAKKIAIKRNQKLSSVVLNNRKALLTYLSENKEDPEQVLGSCPSCKQGDIFKNEYGYKCDNKECKFILWHNSIAKFLDTFSKYIPENTMDKYISIILNKGKVFIDELYSGKKEMFFDAYIAIKYNEKYDNWSLSFEDKKEDSQKKQQEHSPVLNTEEIEEIKSVAFKKENDKLKEDLKTEKEERRLIEDESKKDAMTRAFNRRCFDNDAKKLFEKSKKTLSCAFIDGDKFKDVNDTYGHQAGDEVLKFIVDKMFVHTKNLKRSRVYRYGGEEFIILFADEDKKSVISCVNAIRADLESSKVTYENLKIPITISAGVSFFKDGDTLEKFVERADKGVYLAKENGRNRVEVCYD